MLSVERNKKRWKQKQQNKKGRKDDGQNRKGPKEEAETTQRVTRVRTTIWRHQRKKETERVLRVRKEMT
jgi:hypothetical protein